MRYMNVFFFLLCCLSLACCGAKRDVQLTFEPLPATSSGDPLPQYFKEALFTDKPIKETENLLFYNAYTATEDKVDFVARIADIMEAWTTANQRSNGSIDLVLIKGEGYKASSARLHGALMKPLAEEAKRDEFVPKPAFFYCWVDSTGTNSEQWRNGMTGTQYLVLAQGVPTEKVPRGYDLKQGIHWNMFILQGEMLKAALKNVAQVHAQAKKDTK